MEDGGWDLGRETSGGAKRAGISLRQASFPACGETTVSAARLPQLLSPRRRRWPWLRLCSAPFALVPRLPRQRCCEAAARVPEGWFGRDGGNRCWWRRPRGPRLYRAGPVGVRPGLRPAGLPCRPGPCEPVPEGGPRSPWHPDLPFRRALESPTQWAFSALQPTSSSSPSPPPPPDVPARGQPEIFAEWWTRVEEFKSWGLKGRKVRWLPRLATMMISLSPELL